jgi:hypothetical protein
MKRILFLFTATLILLACSNDDNSQPEEQNTELKIKKFTSLGVDANGTPNGNSLEYFFNEDGTLSQKNEDEANSNYTRIINYYYNPLGQLTKSIMTFSGVNTNRTLAYFYDSSDKLDYITESVDGADPNLYFELTHQPNKITIEYASPGFYTTLNFNNSTITSIDNLFDLGGHSTEDLVYDATNNILERPKVTVSGIPGEPDTFVENSYQYDDKINPLYASYNNYPLNLLGQYWFNLDYWKPFFSPNNFTSEVYTNTLRPEDNYTLLRTFQYNEDGYPTGAVVKKDGALVKELTYEYY